MEQATIFELIHDADKQDQDEFYCKAFKEWMPEQRKILVTWWQSGDEYPYKLMILNKGKKEKQESFKHVPEHTTRACQLMADYYGVDWYKNKDRNKKIALNKIIFNDTIYDGIILQGYTP